MNSSPENISLMMRRAHALKKKPTKSELHIKAMLEKLGIRFMFQKGFCAERKFFIVDFYFPKPQKLCLEIDGDHHFMEPQKSYDVWRDEWLRTGRRLRVIRLSNHEADCISEESLLSLISLTALACKQTQTKGKL